MEFVVDSDSRKITLDNKVISETFEKWADAQYHKRWDWENMNS